MATRYLDQRLKLRHLRVIAAISLHESLLKASKALRLTQPALSRSLQEIEEIVGAKLYERHAKGVRETPFGSALSASARVILAEINRLDNTLDQLANEAELVVTVGVLPVAAVGVMPGLIARLSEQHEELRVRLVQGLTDDLIPTLAGHRLDLIVGRLYDLPAADGLVRETLYHEPISLMARASHPIFDPPGPTLERLRKAKLALPTVASLLGQEIDQLLAEMGIAHAAPIRSSSLGFIREMMQSSDIVTLMPRLMLAGDVLRGSIRVAPLPVPAPDRPAGIIYRADAPLTASACIVVDALKAYVAEALGELPPTAYAPSANA